ncbi:unnamed protein product, partial [Cyprideis torosa]
MSWVCPSVFLWTVLIAIHSVATFDASEDCDWSYDVFDTKGIHMNCKLRTLREDFSSKSIQDSPAVVDFRITCSDVLFSQSTLNNRSFQSFDALQNLDIRYCKLGEIPLHAFDGLTELKNLTIKTHNSEWATMSLKIIRGALENLLSLEYLDLSLNNIWEVYPSTFCSPTRLRFLSLSHNLEVQLFLQENNIDMLEDVAFEGLGNLRMANLSSNKLVALPPSLFEHSKQLRELYVFNNSLSALAPGLFSKLDHLLVLDLSHNEITSEWLKDDTFQDLARLIVFNISHNHLTTLHASMFISLQSLQILRENNITVIEDGIFDGMSQLYGLRLISNQITNISVEALKGLPALKILNVAHNNISYIAEKAFEKNRNLQAIRLDANQIADITSLFVKLPSLFWLNISDNAIAYFDYALVPRSLTYLDLHKNGIKKLGNYYHLNNVLNLHTLDASFNKITEIDRESVPDSIEVVFLNDNLISSIEEHTFRDKRNLTRVDLFANQLSTLDFNALVLGDDSEIRTSPEFYIGGNPFKCDCQMDWLQRLSTSAAPSASHPKIMDLDSVYCQLLFHQHKGFLPIVEVDRSQFLCNYHAHCFTLCHCCDFDACDCEMTCPANCTCYHDATWTSNIVDCSNGAYERVPERLPMDATEVYLDGSHFRSLGSHEFIGRKNMKVLHLNNSGIVEIANQTFNGLMAMRVLHLEDNALTHLGGFEFAGLESLRELYLHNNRLQFIHNITFNVLKSLEILTLHGNLIKTYPVWQLSSNAYLVSVTLSENPWTCDCLYVSYMTRWVEENHPRIPDATEIRCSVSSDLSPILVVQPAEFSDYLPLLLSTLAVFIILVVIAVVGFVFRRDLRVWVHAKCGLRLCMSRGRFQGDDDRLFDAFVTYSSKDEVFATQVLAPELEQGSPSYRLCLHYRDFPVSAYLADTIIEAVESSKRTILILSPNFLSCEWTRFEFKSALHQVLRERRGGRRLIVIVLGDIPQRDLDPDIRLYLKACECLHWGEKGFWEKLRFALPDVDAPRAVSHCNPSSIPTYERPYGPSMSQKADYMTIRSVHTPTASLWRHHPPPLPSANGAPPNNNAVNGPLSHHPLPPNTHSLLRTGTPGGGPVPNHHLHMGTPTERYRSDATASASDGNRVVHIAGSASSVIKWITERWKRKWAIPSEVRLSSSIAYKASEGTTSSVALERTSLRWQLWCKRSAQ